MRDNGSGIPLACAQETLEAASNAKDKGISEFSTPIPLAKILRSPLPQFLPTVTDLTGGKGNLLAGVADPSTTNCLLCDLQAHQNPKIEGRAAYQALDWTRIVGDVTKVYDLLVESGWRNDLTVLNPPFDLHFPKDRFKAFNDSDCDEVRRVLGIRDPRVGPDAIDSTIAIMCVALDRWTAYGEGFVIANNATIQRLITGPQAPYYFLEKHVWLSIVLDGNPMTKSDKDAWGNEFKTAILYFAKSHLGGPQMRLTDIPSIAALEERLRIIPEIRHRLRNGVSLISASSAHQGSAKLFEAVRSEWNQRTKKDRRTDYNIWIAEDGTIGVQLSRYDEAVERLANKRDVATLFNLNGQTPMGLVMQKDTRNTLLRIAKGDVWRVHPDLPAQVDKCIGEYNSVRAPLYPLPETQRLGYLDEPDDILCKKSLRVKGQLLFAEGVKYNIDTQTVLVERMVSKPNAKEEYEDILLNGAELLVKITDNQGIARTFLDAKHRSKEVTVTNMSGDGRAITSDFDLQTIVDHFEIPSVPDVSVTNKDLFEENKLRLDDINCFIRQHIDPKFSFKKFQVDDYSRAACHEGLILAHSTGLGKSIAAIAFPSLRVGIDWAKSKAAKSLVPMAPVLLVAPENLHAQLQSEWKRRFGIVATRLDCQQTYLDMTHGGKTRLAPGWFLSSYTQLGMNKVRKMPIPSQCPGTAPEIAKLMFEFGVTMDEVRAMPAPELLSEGENPLFAKAIAVCDTRYKHFSQGVGEEKNGIKCVFSPSLADLCGHEFACVVIDEGVRIKGEDTIIGRAIRALDPKFRLILTATPIKNRLKDIFWLLWWAAGGHEKPHARLPYGSDSDQQDKFVGEFHVCERNLTQEAKKNNGREVKMVRSGRKKKPRGRPGVEVCSIHRLWKLIAPIVLRRRKQDIGEEIVQKRKQIIRVPMGKKQYETYAYHLNCAYMDRNGQKAYMAQLQALRSVAAAPTSELLQQQDDDPSGMYRSDSDYIPKIAACLSVIEQRIRLGEQCVVFSALHEPLDVLSRRLEKAGVPHDVLDGRKSAVARGKLAAQFQKGLAGGAKPVLLAGVKSMGEGNSWEKANNVILLALDWAYDTFEQAINRCHRLNSIKDVNIFPILAIGTVDRKMECNIGEKTDSCELVLDGKLIGEQTEELNLHELLKLAIQEFKDAEVVEEETCEQEWPSLRNKLADAWRVCQATVRQTIKPQPIRRALPLEHLLSKIKQLQAA